jgi:hypothetical protein
MDADVRVKAPVVRDTEGVMAVSRGWQRQLHAAWVRKLLAVVLAIAPVLVARTASAAWSQAQEFVGVGSNAMAVSGNLAAVGAPFATANGSVVVYSSSGSGTWAQQAVVLATDGASGDEFGFAVALSGTTLFVGTSPSSGHGAVYVFAQSGTQWNQVQKLQNADAANGDSFGASVAVSGSLLLVGAPSPGLSEPGSVYVFSQVAGAFMQQQKHQASNGAAGDQFGTAVALSGTTAVIGAPNAAPTVPTVMAGAAYVASVTTATWSQQQELAAVNGASNDRFGAAVAGSGSTILLGAPNRSTVYFGSVGSSTLNVVAGDSSGCWGTSVALSATNAFVGASCETVLGSPSQGEVVVLASTGRGWTQQQVLTAANGSNFADFGGSLAVSGSTLFVGAPGTGGAVYVFSNPALGGAVATPAMSASAMGWLAVSLMTGALVAMRRRSPGHEPARQ